MQVSVDQGGLCPKVDSITSGSFHLLPKLPPSLLSLTHAGSFPRPLLPNLDAKFINRKFRA